MEVTYERIVKKEMEQGVCLLTITVVYPVFEGDSPAILHINAFEKQYAEALAVGLVNAALPARRDALNAHFTSGGKRSRFPIQRIELTGQGSVDVGRMIWRYRLRTRCGGECVERSGKRAWSENGILQA